VLQEVGTDWAFISPRPYTMMHSMKPDKIVHWYCEAVNDTIALQVKLEPKHFRGIGGLPQCAGVSPKNTFDEIDRCINDLGFVGMMINPDPGEGDGQTPGMGDEYWYPLYEKLVQMDVPGARACGELPQPARVVPQPFHHGRRHRDHLAVELESLRPFSEAEIDHLARRRAGSLSGRPLALPAPRAERHRKFRRATEEAVLRYGALQRRIARPAVQDRWPERCLFGTERPGAGSKKDPRTGRWYDDVRPMIESLEWLKAEQKAKIYEKNAESVFTRFKP
jgi:4-oxalmesaconate hydratase